MSTVSAGSGTAVHSVRPVASMRAPGEPSSAATVAAVKVAFAAITGVSDVFSTVLIFCEAFCRRGESRRKLRPMKK